MEDDIDEKYNINVVIRTALSQTERVATKSEEVIIYDGIRTDITTSEVFPLAHALL